MSQFQTPIIRVLHRPHLIHGCEREPILTVYLFAAMLILLGGNRYSIGIGFLVAIVGNAMLRWAATLDPQAVDIYRRSLSIPRRMPWVARH